MKIQQLSGGLASQVFQYVFLRCGEMADSSHKWYLDDSAYFSGNVYNGYELEKVFGVKPKLLSRFFEPDVWSEYVELKAKGMSIPEMFLKCGEDIVMYAETDDYMMTNPFSGEVFRMEPVGPFYPDILNLNADNLYYHGTWIDENWFELHKDIFLDELKFPEITGKQACKYLKQIDDCYAVALHIRRGDYLDLGINLETTYYREALEKLADYRKDYELFVFSDDLYWCNQHSGELGLQFAPKVTYVSGNFGKESYVDLQLMSRCKGLIMANSAFSYLSALLNRELDFCVGPDKTDLEFEDIKR
ncbi:MAG: alpha-1,2-fucosyltransferase [Lachnospiraceae bacterium]|nr:alpha-1,2-fucosyltransferase [Lachnospiraceae bacterium]